MRHLISNLPDRDLAYLEEGTKHFDEYVNAVGWAQSYARLNRELMIGRESSKQRGRLEEFLRSPPLKRS